MEINRLYGKFYKHRDEKGFSTIVDTNIRNRRVSLINKIDSLKDLFKKDFDMDIVTKTSHLQAFVSSNFNLKNKNITVDSRIKLDSLKSLDKPLGTRFTNNIDPISF